MITEKEEKKLVLKFLGHKVFPHPRFKYLMFKRPGEEKAIMLFKYNPQDNDMGRQCWDEIWDKMDKMFTEKQWAMYFKIIVTKDYGTAKNFRIAHTAKPKICWKTLIPVLQELYPSKKPFHFA